jgi:hypothetical protein
MMLLWLSPMKVEYWYETRNALEAYKLIEQMRARSIVLNPYLDQRMVDDIYKVGPRCQLGGCGTRCTMALSLSKSLAAVVRISSVLITC